jgi:hypothetical protein
MTRTPVPAARAAPATPELDPATIAPPRSQPDGLPAATLTRTHRTSTPSAQAVSAASHALTVWAVVLAAVAWNLVNLWPETTAAPYLNDSSVHEQMVRFATAQISAGHLPLTEWFPYLNLGSPQFLHYQSFGAMLTALPGLVVGPDLAFRWSLYLLLSLWPVSVYVSARLFGLGRAAGASAAAVAPFLMSVPGVGYEQPAYVWIGYGVWAQLWASMTLPLAWAMTWRALYQGRQLAVAAILISLTLAFHFETGYLAALPLLLWPPLILRGSLQRIVRAALVGGSALVASAWVIVPLLAEQRWAAINQALQSTPMVNGYGAGTVLRWLVTGGLLDAGRLPVVSVLAGVGTAVAVWRAGGGDARARALLALLAGCVILSFGRSTLGPVANLIPASRDIFFRRFLMGDQLAGVLLAGVGGGWVVERLVGLADARISRFQLRRASGPMVSLIRALAACAVLGGILAPAWLQLHSFDRRNAAAIALQRELAGRQAAQITRLITRIRHGEGGRVYAGMPSNWGASFTVGLVPVFKYLENADVDEVGYTLRTASLMSQPEYRFDERRLVDYRLFGIHYLILPSSWRPPVPARWVTQSGPYSLWTLAGGYVQAGRIVGAMKADRSDLGTRSLPVLSAPRVGSGYLAVAFDHQRATLADPGLEDGGGTVAVERARLQAGTVRAVVKMRHRGVVVLSASFDPGWRVAIDGHPAHAGMVAPALTAVAVPAGSHTVVFRYRGFAYYPELFVLSVCAVLLLALRRSLPRRIRGGGAGTLATGDDLAPAGAQAAASSETNSAIAPTTTSGCSRWGLWPPGRTRRRTGPRAAASMRSSCSREP